MDAEIVLSIVKADQHGRAVISAKLGETELHRDRLDPARHSARTRFIAALAEKCPALAGDGTEATRNRSLVDVRLLELADALEGTGTKDKPEPDPLADTSKEAIEAALAWLRDPDLLLHIVDDIGRLGLAGEKSLAATLYLVGTSRLLSKPLGAIVQGLSASGKSYSAAMVARLFPPESILHAHTMTPEALYHLRPGALVHRFIIGGERARKQDDATADRTKALREMLADGKLSKMLPVKGEHGIETILISQPGPIAYVESTTLSEIFDEDRNRCLVLGTDETPAQTRRIIALTAERKAVVATDDETESIVARHWTAQRLLRKVLVEIPFCGPARGAFPL